MSVSEFWKKLWKLQVPPKVKDVLWCAATNCLPTKTQLRSRHVNVNAVCPACKTGRESIPHCLVECSFAKSCWTRLDVEIETSVSGTFAEWLQDKIKIFECDKSNRIAMMCWAIWKARNDLVWNNKGTNVDSVVYLAITSLEQWTRAQDTSTIPKAAFLTEEDGSAKWIRPMENVVKINVDAALFPELRTQSFSCVARDNTGMVMEALTCCRAGSVEPEMAEVLGVREALSWIKKKSWQIVVIETDSLMVVQSIRSPMVMLPYFGM